MVPKHVQFRRKWPSFNTVEIPSKYRRKHTFVNNFAVGYYIIYFRCIFECANYYFMIILLNNELFKTKILRDCLRNRNQYRSNIQSLLMTHLNFILKNHVLQRKVINGTFHEFPWISEEKLIHARTFVNHCTHNRPYVTLCATRSRFADIHSLALLVLFTTLFNLTRVKWKESNGGS